MYNISNADTLTTPEQSPGTSTIDYVYYVEWRQFEVGQNDQTSNIDEETPPPTTMRMTRSGALVGDFQHVVDELKICHDKMAAQRGRPKKRVRFQSDAKLCTCIPSVLQGCDVDKIDKKSKMRNHETLLCAELDETKELLISAGGAKSRFLSLIKSRLMRGIFRKMFARKSRRVVPEGVVSNEVVRETKTKPMERSNSYCRHDDADIVILIDDKDCDIGPIVAWNALI